MTFYFTWHVQNERFTCKAFIVDYDLFKGWWCESCPDCNKPLFGLPNNLRCMEHDYPTSAPVSWFNYHTYQDIFLCLLGSELIESSVMVKMSWTFFSLARQLNFFFQCFSSSFGVLQKIHWPIYCSTSNDWEIKQNKNISTLIWSLQICTQ
jgi:hypothetical protein